MVLTQPHDVIIDAKTSGPGVLMDLVSSQPIRWGRWANLTTGQFQAFRSDPKIAKAQGIDLQTLLYEGRSRLQWIPTKKATPAVAPPEPLLALTDPITARRGRPLKLFNVPCDVPTCNRWACWEVSDEVELKPIKHNGRQYEHADITNVRFYCDWHWKPPALYDSKGELITKQEWAAQP